MTGVKDIFIKLMFVGIIFLSMMSWIITTQTENNTQNLITNNALINSSYGGLLTTMNGNQGQSDKASQTFGNINPSQTFGIVQITSIVSPIRIFKGLIMGTYNILIALPAKFLGIPDVIVAVINSILSLLLILGVWIIWKGGGG